MNVRSHVLLAACTALLFCGALAATAAETKTGQNQPAGQVPAGGIIQNVTLVGTTVLDPQGQKLGSIKHVMLNAETGQATFVVLEAAASGTDHGMLVVPYQALKVSFDATDRRQVVRLDRRAEQLLAAPQVRNDQWELLENPQFLQESRNFYQIRTSYTAARPIDNAIAPSLPSQPSMPPPCVSSAPSSGWSQQLEDFYNE